MGLDNPLAGCDAPVASLVEIGRVLEETARLVRQHAGEADSAPAAAPVDARLVRRIIGARRLRTEMIGLPAGDGAWAMMLELFAAALEGRRISQTMLGVAAGVPETTALRLTKKLLAEGYFTEAADPDDRRLILLALSDQAFARMRAYVSAAAAEAGAS
jgi:phage-related tail protein